MSYYSPYNYSSYGLYDTYSYGLYDTYSYGLYDTYSYGGLSDNYYAWEAEFDALYADFYAATDEVYYQYLDGEITWEQYQSYYDELDAQLDLALDAIDEQYFG